MGLLVLETVLIVVTLLALVLFVVFVVTLNLGVWDRWLR